MRCRADISPEPEISKALRACLIKISVMFDEDSPKLDLSHLFTAFALSNVVFDSVLP